MHRGYSLRLGVPKNHYSPQWSPLIRNLDCKINVLLTSLGHIILQQHDYIYIYIYLYVHVFYV